MRSFISNQLREAEYERRVLLLKPEKGATIDDVMQPTAWAHIANQVKEGYRIEVLPEGNDWYAELIVMQIGMHAVFCTLIQYVELSPPMVDGGPEPVAAPAPPPYRVHWAGPHHAWRVIRTSDNIVIKHSFATEPLARAWLDEQQKAGALA